MDDRRRRIRRPPRLVDPGDIVVPYEDLARRETTIRGESFTIRTAALDDINTAKEHADQPKDREAPPELRALRDSRSTGKPGG